MTRRNVKTIAICLPEEMIEEINEMCDINYLSRSQLIAKLLDKAIKEINESDGEI